MIEGPFMVKIKLLKISGGGSFSMILHPFAFADQYLDFLPSSFLLNPSKDQPQNSNQIADFDFY